MRDQLAYPALLLFVDDTGRPYTAEGVPAGDLPNLDTDIGACCWLGDLRRPRYRVDGIERPAFDTNIPADLLDVGWFWRGGWLVQYLNGPMGAGIVIGMPKPGLDAIWESARKITAEQGFIQAERAAQQAKADAKAVAKAKRDERASRRKTPKALPTAVAPAVVVVVQQTHAKQLAMW